MVCSMGAPLKIVELIIDSKIKAAASNGLLKFSHKYFLPNTTDIKRPDTPTPPRTKSLVTFTGSVFEVVRRKTVTKNVPADNNFIVLF